MHITALQRHGSLESSTCSRSLRFRTGALWAYWIVVAALLLWGGVGALDASNAVEVGGALRLQDAIAGAAGVYLAAVLVLRQKWPKSSLILGLALAVLLCAGMYVALYNNIRLRDIALEARPVVYMLLAVLLYGVVSTEWVERAVLICASTMALLILLQFMIVLSGGETLLVSGVNPGNTFTLGLPLIRPVGGLHLVAVGLILHALRRERRLSVGWLLFIALLITQSKTYWLLAGVPFLLSVFVKSRGRGLRSVAVATLKVLFATFGVATLLAFGSEPIRAALLVPLQKFAILFTDADIAYGVLGKRSEEAVLMWNAFTENSASILFGQGLGFIYRDTDLFYWRENVRELEALSMFGHNYYLWLLLKLGVIGFLLTASAIFYSLKRGVCGEGIHRRFVVAACALLIGAVTLGSMENPSGGFLLGLLLAGAASATWHSNISEYRVS